MKKLLVTLLCLVLAAGSALAEGAWYAPPEAPEIPKIKAPDVPDRTATPPPRIDVPEIPTLELPDVAAILGFGGTEGEGEAETEPAPTPSPAPSPAPSAEPAAAVESTAAPDAVPADDVEALLDALGDPVYRRTYEALRAGKVVRLDTWNETARGVQQTLVALGQDIAADGIVGPRTIAALNAVQTENGLEPTKKLDAEGYAALLRVLAGKTAGQGE